MNHGHKVCAFVLYVPALRDFFRLPQESFSISKLRKFYVERYVAVVAERVRDFESDKLIFLIYL